MAYNLIGIDAVGGNMISYEETIERLKYIADSPPREQGGFHEEAIKTAKAALYQLKKKKKANGVCRVLCEVE